LSLYGPILESLARPLNVNDMDEKIEAIKKLIRQARHIAVLTGAGVSAESGIPTFRDPLTGLWANYRISDFATPAAFRRDKALVWGWSEWLRMLVMKARPNPAHLAIAALAGQVPALTVITQNVDDLHERAGSQNVIHLHGDAQRPYCFACKRAHVFPPGIPDEPEGGRRLDPPRCAHCNGYIRPGVVWFGEMLPRQEWDAASKACEACDLMFVIGTSSLVEPAASLPKLAVKRNAPIVQINPARNALSYSARFNLLSPAGEVMPLLVKE
jgi:NAD-dependent deacetylase